MAPGDYGAVTNEIITFTTGQTRTTHRITIHQDDICENSPNENFFVGLKSDLPMINLIRRRTEVIIDDSECSKCHILCMSIRYIVIGIVRREGETSDDVYQGGLDIRLGQLHIRPHRCPALPRLIVRIVQNQRHSRPLYSLPVSGPYSIDCLPSFSILLNADYGGICTYEIISYLFHSLSSCYHCWL